MGRVIDMKNQVFGRLTVVERAGSNADKKALWLCNCTCGNTAIVSGKYLRAGLTQSCGCLHKEQLSERSTKHGMRYTKEWLAWRAMLDRCYNPNQKRFEDYGGRGISVCPEWRHSFETFYKDMGDRPEGKSLDRIDNNGNYEPNNCRWATKKEQANNKRNNITLDYLGETFTLSDLADSYNIAYGTLWYRTQKLNQPLAEALLNPIGRWNN